MIGSVLNRIKGRWRELSQSLGFVPGVIVVVFAVLGIGLVELDRHVDISGYRFIFGGDGSAARTVLSVVAGSLITVAGLTFSITIVVLQLASSQFSPRILRTFFGDRITQLTIGTYVGTFVYSLLVLRAVGSFGDAGFVPRLSITFASLFGIGAVVLLVVYLHHVSKMIQVSHVTARISHDALARIESLYPRGFGEPAEDESPTQLLASWRSQDAGRVLPRRPGYVQYVSFGEDLGSRAERLAILVRPGDFVSIEVPIAEVWPPEAVDGCRAGLLDAVTIRDERDVSQDLDFAIRQLADIAIKAMSPGINDPMTAVTCVSYMRSILVRVTERADPPEVRQFPDRGLTAIVRGRHYEEYLESFLQLNRYVGGDAWVIGEMLKALMACREAAYGCGAQVRVRSIDSVAATIAERAADELKGDRDRESVAVLTERFGGTAT